MKKILFVLSLFALLSFSLRHKDAFLPDTDYIAQLRATYSSGDPTQWEAPTLDSSVVATFTDIGSLPPASFPPDNPFTEAKKQLGKTLFFDPRLSRSGQIACASCHDPELGWGDARTVSFGHNRQTGTRNAMTLFNIAYHQHFFWDGRAATLEEQFMGPLTDPVEMHGTKDIAVKRIRKIKGYKPLFKAAFGDEQVTITRIAQAVATYQRTIRSGRTKFDRFIGGESNAYTDEEVWGLHLFRTKARCINCHNGALFSDQQFHNIGLSYYGRKFEDLGRYKHTHQPNDVGRFKTASLREVERTAPYMHNGFMPDLKSVVEFYNTGVPTPKRKKEQLTDPLFPSNDALLKPLHLTPAEQAALVAFLKTLTSPLQRERLPERF